MDVILASLLPLALVVTAGALLLRFGFYDDTIRRSLDLLVYWVCLPAMIVHSLLGAPATGLEEAGPMTIAMAIATLGGTAVALLVAFLFQMERASVGVFAQAAMRGNLAYVGLPVIALAVDGDPATLAKASLVLAPSMFLFNVLGVFLLVGGSRHGGSGMNRAATVRRLAVLLITNPLLLAGGLGLAMWWMQVTPGDVVMETLDLLGMPAATLALLSLGGAILVHPVHGRLVPAAGAAVLKCAVVPAIALGCCGIMGIHGVDRQIVLVFAATPTAVATNVLAAQLGGDEPLAAASVVVSTIASAGSLAAALALCG